MILSGSWLRKRCVLALLPLSFAVLVLQTCQFLFLGHKSYFESLSGSHWLDHHDLGDFSNSDEGGIARKNIPVIRRIIEGNRSSNVQDLHVPIVFNSTHYDTLDRGSPSRLPPALLPAAPQEGPMGCCKLASQINQTIMRLDCHGICHTPAACVDPQYPFVSPDQKLFFELVKYNKRSAEGMQHRSRCNSRSNELKPPFRWCRQWTNATRHIDPFDAGLPPPGCSVFSEGGGSGSYQHVILFPTAKLAFCGIPKVGITQWIQFLRFTLGARDYLSFPHAKRDVRPFRFDKLIPERQLEILNVVSFFQPAHYTTHQHSSTTIHSLDPEWKFAVFLRDPAERLLSAYLDKVGSDNYHQEQHFKDAYGLNHTLSFEEFLSAIAQNRTLCSRRARNREEKKAKLPGVDWCTDPHWRPQTYSCGISEFLPRFSSVGSLDRSSDQTKQLLKNVGLWDNYGRFYHWHVNKQKNLGGLCNVHPPKISKGELLLGFQQNTKHVENHPFTNANNDGVEGKKHILQSGKMEASDTSYGHATNSQSKLNQYYTPSLLKIVRQLYEQDYKLWDLIKDEKDMVDGATLAAKLSPECKSLTTNTTK